jgi:hypothetical protein
MRTLVHLRTRLAFAAVAVAAIAMPLNLMAPANVAASSRIGGTATSQPGTTAPPASPSIAAMASPRRSTSAPQPSSSAITSRSCSSTQSPRLPSTSRSTSGARRSLSMAPPTPPATTRPCGRSATESGPARDMSRRLSTSSMAAPSARLPVGNGSPEAKQRKADQSGAEEGRSGTGPLLSCSLTPAVAHRSEPARCASARARPDRPSGSR